MFCDEDPLAATVEDGKGYYPAQIGSTFREGRYTIVRKLRVSENATVWLVWDKE
jgi:hypothetical protein